MLRFVLLAALVAVLPARAFAQPISEAVLQPVPVEGSALLPTTATRSVGARPGAPTAPVTEPNTATAAACTGPTTFGQATSQTSAFVTTAGGNEEGQSFTATCDGLLATVTSYIYVNPTVGGPGYGTAGVPFAATLYVYQGAGTLGPVLAAYPFTATNPSPTTATAYNLAVSLSDPVALTTGQVYTFFLDITSGSVAVLFSNTAAYAGGMEYYTSDGNPATAVADPAYDMRFSVTLQVPTTVSTPVVYNGPGFRLLSPPVRGVTVKDLAAANLVQGIPAFGASPSLYPVQYPTATPNLYAVYNGAGGYTAPSSTGTALVSGQGFFWQWYDQAITPNPTGFGGGTSTSSELTGYTLSQTGVAATANVTLAYPVVADGYYMVGNPFTLPFAVSGFTKTAGDGTLVTSVQVYDPALPGFRILFASNPANGGASDYVAVWDGFFAQVTGGTTAPTFTYALASTSTTATPPFYGRDAASTTPYLQLRLDGTTASGVHVADEAAYVRFLPDALLGSDADDADKLTPPQADYALLAPVSERDGAPVRLAVNALPDALAEDMTVPVAFAASEAGTFTVAWDGAASLPEGWSATLRDSATGALIYLRSAESYTFEAQAGEWSERFALVVASRGATAGEPTAPAERTLTAPRPNPTTGRTALTLRLPAAEHVTATLVDVLGRTVATLYDSEVSAASDVTIVVDGAQIAPGAYVVRVQGTTFVETRRVTVAR